MGVDYLTCQSCDRGYRDDSDYACYCDCNNNFCSEKCGKLDNFLDPATQDEPEEGDPAYQDYVDGNCHIDHDKPITCVLCRNEKYTDYILLKSLMSHFNLTKDQVIEIWKTENGK